MAEPTFFVEGNAPRREDTKWKIEQKILGAIRDGGGSTPGTGGATVGAVDPEGVETADPGALYYNSATGAFWVKETGTGNTGWVALITA